MIAKGGDIQRSDSLIERLDPAIIDPADPEMVELTEVGQDRFKFASMFAEGRRVLCLTCGAGYGPMILKKLGKAAEIVGVDFDERWIEIANKRYQAENISYSCVKQGDVDFQREFDLVVSHETFKYLRDPLDLMQRIERALKPGGDFIASVYTITTTDFNPYHIRDYSYREFKRLLRRAGFTIVYELWQFKYYTLLDAYRLAKIKKPAEDTDKSPRSLLFYYLAHPLKALKRAYALLRHGMVTKIVTVRAKRTVDL